MMKVDGYALCLARDSEKSNDKAARQLTQVILKYMHFYVKLAPPQSYYHLSICFNCRFKIHFQPKKEFSFNFNALQGYADAGSPHLVVTTKKIRLARERLRNTCTKALRNKKIKSKSWSTHYLYSQCDLNRINKYHFSIKLVFQLHFNARIRYRTSIDVFTHKFISTTTNESEGELYYSICILIYYYIAHHHPR